MSAYPISKDSPYGRYGESSFRYSEADWVHRSRHDEQLRLKREQQAPVSQDSDGVSKLVSGGLGLCLFLAGIGFIVSWIFENWLFLIIGGFYGVIYLTLVLVLIAVCRVVSSYSMSKSTNLAHTSFKFVIRMVIACILISPFYAVVGYVFNDNNYVSKINDYALTVAGYAGRSLKWSWNIYVNSIDNSERGIRKFFDIEKEVIVVNEQNKEELSSFSKTLKILAEKSVKQELIQEKQNKGIANIANHTQETKPTINKNNNVNQSTAKTKQAITKEAEILAAKQAEEQMRLFNEQLKAQQRNK